MLLKLNTIPTFTIQLCIVPIYIQQMRTKNTVEVLK